VAVYRRAVCRRSTISGFSKRIARASAPRWRWTLTAYYYQNELFHQQIYDGSHNVFLREQATALHRRLRPYRRLQLRVRDRLPTSFHEHEAIVDAIIAGDADLSAQRMREHVVVQGQRFADLIASLAGLHRESMAQAATDNAQRTTALPPARSRRSVT
jgi:DNA-binding GntR family transcriptional regulator